MRQTSRKWNQKSQTSIFNREGCINPIWAHMGPYVFLKSDTFRVQTAPFDKITIDFCRSRRRLHDSDFILTKNLNIWLKIPKIPKNPEKYPKINGFPWISIVEPLWSFQCAIPCVLRSTNLVSKRLRLIALLTCRPVLSPGWFAQISDTMSIIIKA